MPNIEALKQARRIMVDLKIGFDMRCLNHFKPDCGTAHCLAGWICLDPWFRANTAIGQSTRARENGVVEPAGLDDNREARRADKSLENVHDAAIFAQVQGVLGLDADDRDALLGLNTLASWLYYASEWDVIANIDRLIAGKRAVRYTRSRRVE